MEVRGACGACRLSVQPHPAAQAAGDQLVARRVEHHAERGLSVDRQPDRHRELVAALDIVRVAVEGGHDPHPRCLQAGQRVARVLRVHGVRREGFGQAVAKDCVRKQIGGSNGSVATGARNRARAAAEQGRPSFTSEAACSRQLTLEFEVSIASVHGTEQFRYTEPSRARKIQSNRGMRLTGLITAVDAHAGGEPGRVIIGGVLDVAGASMFEKRLYLEQHADWLRKRMLRRPRGYPGLCCNLILPPTLADADAGFVIMEQTDYPPM